jgi:uncharacterized protein YjiS (DUF1127 family)
MAYAGSILRLPAATPLPHFARTSFASVFAIAAAELRRRWVYHRTLAELREYSERSLRDLGADRGIEEFARRAAGLSDVAKDRRRG